MPCCHISSPLHAADIDILIADADAERHFSDAVDATLRWFLLSAAATLPPIIFAISSIIADAFDMMPLLLMPPCIYDYAASIIAPLRFRFDASILMLYCCRLRFSPWWWLLICHYALLSFRYLLRYFFFFHYCFDMLIRFLMPLPSRVDVISIAYAFFIFATMLITPHFRDTPPMISWCWLFHFLRLSFSFAAHYAELRWCLP